jgi:hypothetical protein
MSQTLSIDSHPGLPRKDSSNYWETREWGGAGTLAESPSPTIRPPHLQTVKEGFQKKDFTAAPKLPRVSSDAYWDADQWDPDERVYVGAEAGLGNHWVAVLEKGSDQLSRAWTGGWVSNSLQFGGEIGMPFNIEQVVGSSLTLKDMYEVEPDSVGAGAFAVVRPAKHLASGTPCVVKMINKANAGEKYRRNVESGLYETLMTMSKRTPHENVVQYLDFLESSDNYYVIMERLQGKELLAQVEADFPLTEDYCRGVMCQVLAALKHLHEVVGLCHRDVKLANFCFRGDALGAQERLVLLDFGFASRLSEEWDGTICGTRMFMPPEAIAGSLEKRFLAASDLWAAGVIFYVLLTGEHPFQDEEMATLARLELGASELMERAFAAPELVSVSIQALDLLRGLLSLEPGSRLTAAQAFAHDWFSVTADCPPKVLGARKESYQRALSASVSVQQQTSVFSPRKKRP